MMQMTTRKISCSRCRYRKLKCSRTEPCQSCLAARQTCEYRKTDLKRRPASAEYTSSLERHILQMESLIKELHRASPEERDLRLKSFMLKDASYSKVSVPSQGPSSNFRYEQGSLRPGPGGSLNYHGPTSIYHCWSSEATSTPSGSQNSFPPFASTSLKSISEVFGLSLQGETITNGLILFFRWQYPYFPFIYREAFLRDYFGDHQNCKYWSAELLLAICALGLQMSSDSHELEFGDCLYSTAESVCTISGLPRPSIPTVQTFLCLALYALNKGDMSKSWSFSGIAFRMAQELGFQKDPGSWVVQDLSIVTQEDIEIRRRIYWGCYTSDKFISLILGRSVQLPWQDASVELTDSLPDFPQMEPWLPVGFSKATNGLSGSSSLIPFFREQIRLSRIIERLLSGLLSLQGAPQNMGWEIFVSDLNLELYRWNDTLPESVKWNEWEPFGSPLVPTAAALHLLFHSTLIALNIVIAESSISNGTKEESRSICLESAQKVSCLVRRYRRQYTLQYAPSIMIYGISQATRSFRNLGSFQDECDSLYSILSECSATWGLAAQALVHVSQSENRLGN